MFEIYPHQEKAVQEMGNGCVLAGDVGSGKTITALEYARRKESGRDIYVITTAKKRDSGDWEHDAARLALPVDGFKVDSWNNIAKYVDVENAFFIFDEQRLVGTGAWVKSFLKIVQANQWILCSATPGDTWLDYVPVFLAHGFYKNVTDFRQQHVIYSRFSKFPKVERYVNTGLLQRRRQLVLVEMPMVRHTTRHIETVDVEYDKELFDTVWKKRWNVYTEEPIKDAGELFRVGRKVVGTHESRLEAVKCLMEKHPKLIVFYNFDYELEMLRTLVPPDQLASPESIEQLAAKINSRKDLTSSSKTRGAGRSGQSSSDRTTASSMSMTSPSSSSPESSDPLAGTIWEEGWDQSLWEKAYGQSLLSRPSESSTSDTSFGTGGVIPWYELEHTGQRTSTASSSSLDTLENSSTLTRSKPSEDFSRLESSDSSTNEAVRHGKSFAVAEWNGHKHEPIPTTDRWVYLVQYTSGSEGWNCIETDAMIFFSLTYSYKQFYQAQGRIDRMNTSFKDLYYYVLATKSVVDKAVWRSLKGKKDFNVRRYAA